MATKTVCDWKRRCARRSVAATSSGLRVRRRTARPTRRVGAYAAALHDAVGKLYPTERFLGRLANDRRDAHPLVAARADIEKFVANNPDFHLLETPVEGLLSERPRSRASRTKGLTDRKGTVALIKGVQRIARLVPDVIPLTAPPADDGAAPLARFDLYDAATRLVADGLDSAPGIVARPRTSFVDDYSKVLGGPEGAELVYTRARAVTDVSLMKALEIHELAYPDIESAQPTVTTIRDLFGSVDLCECEHCSSMTSPAAYLFDCLKLLQDGPRTASGGTPLDVLVGRRPTRSASRSTATTPRPSCRSSTSSTRSWSGVWPRTGSGRSSSRASAPPISRRLGVARPSGPLRAAFANGSWELSPEASVNAAVRDASGAVVMWHVLDAGRLFEVRLGGATFTVVSLTFQTVGSEDELRAAPAHVVPAAYRILAGEVFPWHLPFALPHAEIEAYLREIGTSIADVLAAFDNDGPVAAARRDDVAASYLGLSPDEFAIIVGQKLERRRPDRLRGPARSARRLLGRTRGHRRGDPDGARFSANRRHLGRRARLRPAVPAALGADVRRPAPAARLLLRQSARRPTRRGRRPRPRRHRRGSAGRSGRRAPSGRSGDSSGPPPPPDPDRRARRRRPGDVRAGEADAQGLDVPALKRIHRFVRLKRALKWDYVDLDRALTALGAADLDEDTVVALTLIDRLAQETGWPVRELCGLWGDLDHVRYIDRSDERQGYAPTLYEDLFRKSPQVSAPDPAFVAAPSALAGKLADHAAALTAALTISQTDLDALLADARVVPADADLTLANLSSVYRFAALASFAGISAAQLLALLDMAPRTPSSHRGRPRRPTACRRPGGSCRRRRSCSTETSTWTRSTTCSSTTARP